MFNRTTVYVLIAAIAAALGLWAAQAWFAHSPSGSRPPLKAARLFDPPRAIPPFSLRQSDGTPLVPGELKGHWTLVFLGFTHCPDVCPTTLARMVRLRQQLGAGDRPFEILFVTVDPKRDGPAEVGKYAELFDSPVTGLTGSPAQIEQAKKQFGIFSQQVPDGSGGYSVDHTATVLLFDRQGKFTATIAPEEQDSAALAKLRRITG